MLIVALIVSGPMISRFPARERRFKDHEMLRIAILTRLMNRSKDHIAMDAYNHLHMSCFKKDDMIPTSHEKYNCENSMTNQENLIPTSPKDINSLKTYQKTSHSAQFITLFHLK